MNTGRVLDPASGTPFRPARHILAHPRFATARNAYIGQLSALYSGKPFLSHMMGEAVRAVMFGLIICLHVNYRPDDRSSQPRSEEHTSELQSLMRISYAVFCLKKKK